MGDQELTGDKGTKTLTSSGCGTFAMSCIVSGLLGMEIDPITYLNNLDEYFPYGNYYSYDNGFMLSYKKIHSFVLLYVLRKHYTTRRRFCKGFLSSQDLHGNQQAAIASSLALSRR